MMSSVRTVAAILLSCLAGAGAARAELSLERVGQYLPLAPSTLAAAPIFSFYDIDGFLRSARLVAPGAAEPDRWQGVSGLPVPLLPRAESLHGLRRATGIDGLALARVLSVGTPPSDVLVLSWRDGMADAVTLAAVLAGRGFARTVELGWDVWHRFEDFRISIRDRDVDDPFGGALGAAARIAVRGGEIVGTRAWPVLRAELLAIDGRVPSLSGIAEFAAVLHGTADAARRLDGVAIRAVGFHVGHVGAVPLDPAALLQGTVEQARAALQEQARRRAAGEALPPYVFAVLAELSAGNREAGVIALSYGTEAGAQQGAALLARRLTASPTLAGRGAQVDSRVVALPAQSGGPTAWSAVAVAAYAVDPAVPSLFGQWLQGVYNRDFAPLALEAQ